MNSNPFHLIEKIQPTLPGWCSLEKAVMLASIVVGYRPAASLEIGIYGGSSFIPIALAHKAIGYGVVYGIEPWSKEEALKAQTTMEDVAWWQDQDLEALYSNFIAKLAELDLGENVRIVRSPSRSVSPMAKLGLLHIDGAHSDEAVRDVLRFAPHVEFGGFCVMDDIGWSGGGVARAVLRLREIGFVERYKIGTGAVFQRV